ncbi:MAG: YggS family pyridoxal phosphate-dependent enzyme [Muribaculaceae bacterium]|nr:YggS family pyridoxal phosphate-dependent enzyme [Muribaculaceae bacterium]
MNIGENIRDLKAELPSDVKLVAVSKFHPANMIMEAYEVGQRLFGESRVQELLQKQPLLPQDIKWHFIGHLQTNKVRQIIGKVALIESVDSVKLLELIDKESQKCGMVTEVLMQIHVAKEENKFGFYPDELLEFFNNNKFEQYRSVKIRGVMGMASNTDDNNRVREDFRRIHSAYLSIKKEIGNELPDFNILSMGMSGDWPIAVEEGSNLVRIGSSIFGSRI